MKEVSEDFFDLIKRSKLFYGDWMNFTKTNTKVTNGVN